MLISTFSHIVMKIVVPVIMAKWLVSLVVGSGSSSLYIFGLFCSYAIALFSGFIADFIFIKVTDKRYKELVGQFHDAVTEREVNFFRNEKAGALSSLFRNYLDGTINLLRLTRVNAIPLFVSIFLPIIILAQLSVTIAAIFGAAVLLRGYLSVLTSKKLRPLRKKALGAYSELSGMMSDHMAHLAVLKVSANIKLHRRTITDLADVEAQLFWKRHKKAIQLSLAGNIVIALCFIVIFYLVSTSSLQSDVKLYLAVLAIIFSIQGMNSAQELGELSQRWSERWEHVVGTIDKIKMPGNSKKTQTSTNNIPNNFDIKFSDVAFSYDGNVEQNAIFESLNLLIPFGTHLAISGSNGSGKSTLLSLLLKFDQITGGHILFDQVNLEEISPNILYRAISYAPQGTKLFNATIRENLLYFEPDVSSERFDTVCNLVGLTEMASEFSKGLDTSVGEMGSLLSGGQRQRIVIARALMRDAQVYLLDEPTSNLDPESSLKIIQGIQGLLKGRTLIIVTHSPEMTDVFSKTLIIDNQAARWQN